MDLWDALLDKSPDGGKLHCWNGKRFEKAPWSEVVADSRRLAQGLRRRGVGPGSRVAAVLTNSGLAVRGVLAAWLSGATLASLPVPARGMDLEDYREQLRILCGHLEPEVLVVDEQLIGLLPETLPGATTAASWESLEATDPLDPSPPSLDEVAFIQYSSGSTGRPKGCMLTGRAIAAQLEILQAYFAGEPGGETICSWLPLSHDMGLFGCLVYSWAWDQDLALSSPERFMQSPRTWFADMSKFGCTLTAGTGSALAFAARAQRSGLPEPLRLRSLVLGAERIEAETLEVALETFGPLGLRPTAVRPAYGLAEATLAVTASALDEAPRVRSVDAMALADGDVREVAEGAKSATRIVSLGRPCPGVELRLADGDRLSEVYVRSPSIFSGYWADPEATRERLGEGEVATRDLGFLDQGELHLVGRSDDVIPVAGRNVYAREIETAVGALDGVRRGCCTIVEVPGSDLAMLMELRDGRTDFSEIAAAAARTAKTKAGVVLSECVFLEKGALPKTPTGKVQRYRCRELLVNDRLEPVSRVRTGRGRGALAGA